MEVNLIRERALLGDELWLEQGRGCNDGDLTGGWSSILPKQQVVLKYKLGIKF